MTNAQIQNLLDQGYEVFTTWYFNMTSDTGSIGHREYQLMKSKDGKITFAN